MTAFLALLKINFKRLLITTSGMGTGRKNRKKAATGIGAIVFLSIIMLYISGTYSFMMAYAFKQFGAMELMLVNMLVIAMVFPCALTMFSSQGMIFSTKDIDFVLSIPVSAFSVMLSRIMALYLEILLMVEMILIPAGIAWIYYGGNPVVLPLLIISGLFLSFIPTAVSMIFGCIISLLVSGARYKNLLISVFSILFVVLIIAGSFMFSGSLSGSEIDIANLRNVMETNLWLVFLIVNAIIKFYPLVFAAIMLSCLATILLVTWLFSLFYKPLLTRLASQSVKHNYKMKRVSASGSFTALIGKEARRFFGTPIYFLNFGFMPIIYVGGAIFSIVKKDVVMSALEYLAKNDAGTISSYIPELMLIMMVFTIIFTLPACVSISLEGKYLWILKEAPVGTGQIFAAKSGFNFLLIAITVIIAQPLFGYALGLSMPIVAMLTITELLLGLMVSLSGLVANLLLPRLDAENDTIIVKQSSSLIFSMLANVIIVALCVGVWYLTNITGLGFGVFIALTCAILAVIILVSIVFLNTKGRKIFASL